MNANSRGQICHFMGSGGEGRGGGGGMATVAIEVSAAVEEGIQFGRQRPSGDKATIFFLVT